MSLFDELIRRGQSYVYCAVCGRECLLRSDRRTFCDAGHTVEIASIDLPLRQPGHEALLPSGNSASGESWRDRTPLL